MSKRANGDGSVYRVRDGGGWAATVSYLDPMTGRMKRRKRRARTKAAAMSHLRAMQRELGDYGHLPNVGRTVSSAVEDYLEVRAGQNLELGANLNDRWAVSLIVKGLGTRPVVSLSVQECDQFLAAAAGGRFGGPLGRDQLKRLRGRLTNTLENDRRRGLVTRNVAELSVLPEISPQLVPRRPRRALSTDELRRLIGAASGAVLVLVDLSARHGLRPAEARALRWSRLDLNELTVRVDAQINRRNEITKPKTKRSLRTIRIDSETADRLITWRADQEAAEVHAEFAWSGNLQGLIATTALGTPINQRNVYRAFALASRKAGIEPGVSGYDLRHTAITFQVEKGHTVHQIADWAGTSERMIIDVYRHKLNDITDLGPSDG